MRTVRAYPGETNTHEYRYLAYSSAACLPPASGIPSGEKALAGSVRIRLDWELEPSISRDGIAPASARL